MRKYRSLLFAGLFLGAFAAVPASASALCNGMAATVAGATSGPDTLTGTAGVDVIEGLGGNDTISGLDGNDTICGDDGDDVIDGGFGSDHLEGGTTGETNGDTVTFASLPLAGSPRVSQLNADLQAQTADTGVRTDPGDVLSHDVDTLLEFENLTGTNTFDTLAGDNAANVITGLNAADGFQGRNGNDTIVDPAFPVDFGAAVYSDATGPVTGAVGDGTHTITGAGVGTDTLTNIRGVEGSNFGDQLIGTATSGDSLNGGVGDDVLTGLGGNDFLIGGDNNDTLEPGAGSDYSAGGNGIDTVTYAGETGPIVADLTAANPNVTTPGGTEYIEPPMENLIGTPQNDDFTGGIESNIFDGRGGDDHFVGGGAPGSDTVSFAGLAQTVQADLNTGTASGQSTDPNGDTFSEFENLTGSSGDDTLTGDAAANVLDGGAGVDHIIGMAGADSLLLGLGADVVTANDGQVDSIDCTGGGPDSGSVDGPTPAETYTGCDSDGDSVVDFLDACPTSSGTGTDGCVPVVTTPPQTQPTPTSPTTPTTPKKKCKKKKHRAVSAKKCKKKKK